MLRFVLHIVPAFALMGCMTSEPLAPPSDADVIVQVHRDVLVRGTRGARTSPPGIVRRNYDMACTKAGATSPEARAAASVKQIDAIVGKVTTSQIGTRSLESSEQRKANPTITERFGCRILRTNTTQGPYDMLSVLTFVKDNNLAGELMGKR